MKGAVTELSSDQARALTIKEPWTSAILCQGKTVENRVWPTNYRGLLIIHASVHFDKLALYRLSPWKEQLTQTSLRLVKRAFVTGALVGVVELVDCVRDHDSAWAESGFWHWVLAKPRKLREPLPYRGQQSLFPLPRELRQRVIELL